MRNETLYNNLKNEYETYRTTLRRSIREAKWQYNTFNTCTNDIKKTWSVINDTINTQSKKDNHFDFVLDNQIITNPVEIAIKLNYYFLNIGQSLSNKIHYSHPPVEYLTKPTQSRITFDHVSANAIFDIINKLKKKSRYAHA